jgi:hypothetical protein
MRAPSKSWWMRGFATSIGLASILLLLSKCERKAPKSGMYASRGSWTHTGTWEEFFIGLGGLVVAFVLVQVARRWESDDRGRPNS